MTNSIRYKYAPQMKYYDYLGFDFIPYATFVQKKSFSSEIINTDKYGYRFTKFNNQVTNIENIDQYNEVNLLIGASTVFGVGATNDEYTISSYLTKLTGECWINLGIRSQNSLQEYINLIQYAFKTKVKRIVFLSGGNDIYIDKLDQATDYDLMFGWSDYHRLYSKGYTQKFNIFKRVYTKILSMIYSVKTDKIIGKPYAMQMDIINNIKNKKEIEKITLEMKLDRNFRLYSSLAKALDCQIYYFQQPYLTWLDKVLSKEENELINNSKIREKNQTILEMDYNEKLKSEYCSLFQKHAQHNDIPYFNLNSLKFTDNEFLFIDRMHLTDQGNEIVANQIKSIIF